MEECAGHGSWLTGVSYKANLNRSKKSTHGKSTNGPLESGRPGLGEVAQKMGCSSVPAWTLPSSSLSRMDIVTLCPRGHKAKPTMASYATKCPQTSCFSSPSPGTQRGVRQLRPGNLSTLQAPSVLQYARGLKQERACDWAVTWKEQISHIIKYMAVTL